MTADFRHAAYLYDGVQVVGLLVVGHLRDVEVCIWRSLEKQPSHGRSIPECVGSLVSGNSSEGFGGLSLPLVTSYDS